MKKSFAYLLLFTISAVQAPAQQSSGGGEQKQRSEDASEVKEEATGAKSTAEQLASGPNAPVDPKSFQLGPEDVLMVRVWNQPQISGVVSVRPDGKIGLPLIGEIEAKGTTPHELTQKVTEALSTYYKDPLVMITVQALRSRKYYVTGQIAKGGMFPLVTPTTVLQAISIAGGPTEWADLKKITILRNGKVLKFNYKDAIKGKNLDQNILLEGGDHIIVP